MKRDEHEHDDKTCTVYFESGPVPCSLQADPWSHLVPVVFDNWHMVIVIH